MSKPSLFCIHNRDWPVNSLTGNPLFARGTYAGAAFHNAMLSAAGMLPKGRLPDDELQAFKDQVAALPNMQDAG